MANSDSETIDESDPDPIADTPIPRGVEFGGDSNFDLSDHFQEKLGLSPHS